MAISKQKKAEILAELVQRMSDAKSVCFAKNTGLSVTNISDLRTALRETGSKYQIAKKTLLKKAAKDSLEIDVADEVLDGAVGAAFSFEDDLAAIKALAKFAKGNDKLEIVGGIFEGRAITKAEAVALSKIPSREELLAKLLGSMQSPLSGFVGVGNQLISGLARVLDGYREQKTATETA